MKTTRCPLCKSNINIRHRTWVGENIRCPSCEAELEVVFLNPLELDWPIGLQDYKLDDSLYEEFDYID